MPARLRVHPHREGPWLVSHGRRRLAVPPELAEALKLWRLGTAQKKGIPAFRVLTDRTLAHLAAARPRNTEELLAVTGIGPSLAQKYGKQLLAICARGR